ncbi:PKD domain-containing protein [Desulfurivibrio sp. D14AmB]|uniref:PKD domain-containing protein n=1 Tax=Desulfurivibrio sp. D14AmB TaxID=3374370 RepID=UPI00376EC97A
MYKGKVAMIAIVALLLAAFLTACSSGSSSPPPPTPTPEDPAVTATISGQVTGSGGLADVLVAGGGNQTHTDTNGFFTLEVEVPEDNRVVLSFSKSGRVPATRVVNYTEGVSDYALALSLRVPTAAATVNLADVDALEVTDNGNGGQHKMTIGNLQQAIGDEGTIEVSAYYGDPTSEEGRQSFPGDFMAARSDDPEESGQVDAGDADILLESVVFTDISITNGNGQQIETFNGEWLLVEMRLPDELQNRYQAGDYIEWWSFDEEKGIWVQEHAFPEGHSGRVIEADGFSHALIFNHETENALYARAYARHLSWWNVDVPVDQHAVVCVDVVDEDDEPLANVQVEARGVTFQSSTYATTASDGRACMTVKRSTDESNPETITVHGRLGSFGRTYDVTDAEEGDPVTDEIYVPTADGSTIRNTNPENWLVLSNKLVMAYDGRIQGSVTYEDSGLPAVGIRVRTNLGVTALTDAVGDYELKVPQGTVLVAVVGASSREVAVGAEAVTADFIIPNQAPVIDDIQADPGLMVDAGTLVVFQAVAHDPDGDPITYQWQANVGTPTSGSGATFNWRAPSGTGTATITLTVSDDKGREAQASRQVIYGGEVAGTSLKITVKDEPSLDNPVSDAYVILHATDGIAVDEYLTTGTDGVADFGDIGRDRATVTIAYEFAGEWTNRVLDTMVDMPVADMVYYVGSDDFEMTYFDGNLDWGTAGRPASVNSIGLVHPYGWSAGGDLISGFFYDDQLQEDGTISLVAAGFDTASQMVRYGYLLDQNPADSPFTITVDRTPALLDWTADRTLNSLFIFGWRANAEVGIGRNFNLSSETGTLAWADGFPTDSYSIKASGTMGEGANDWLTVLNQSAIPASLNIPVAGFNLADLSYDLDNKRFTWQLLGEAAAVDYVEVSVYAYEWSWTAAMAPAAAGSFSVPDLPTAIADWVDFTVPPHHAGIEAGDFDTVSGYDHLAATYVQGDHPELISNRIMWAFSWLEEDWEGEGTTPQALSASGSETLEQPQGSRKKPGDGIMGLLRR